MDRLVTGLICLLGLGLTLALRAAHIRIVWKLALNLLCGFTALVFLNYFGAMIDIKFGFNLITMAIVGFLGLPGVGFLLIFNLLR